MRTKNRKCPICGKMFSSQGLAGHARWVHELDPAEVRNVLDGIPLPQPPEPASAPASKQQEDGSNAGGWLAAILVAGLGILAAIAASKQGQGEGKGEERDRVYCGGCKQPLDVSEARRQRVQVVKCPKCGQLNALPALPGAPQAAAQHSGGVAGAP